MDHELTPQDWRTLQTAPLWVLSAILGRQNRFDPLELAAFWRALDDTAAGSAGLANAVLVALSADFSARLREHEQEERSVVTGLWDVTAILSRLDSLVAAPFATALLEVGEQLSRARGAFGKVISREDGQTLALLAALLEIGPAAGTFDEDAFA